GRTRMTRPFGAMTWRTRSTAAAGRPREMVPSGTRRGRCDRLQESFTGLLDIVYGGIEGHGVAGGRLAEATDFADELQRGGADFLVGRWFRRATESLDTSAHGDQSAGQRVGQI